jgi:hypothetical protein
MILRRLFGAEPDAASRDAAAPPSGATPAVAGGEPETATVRRIVSQLQELPLEQRRYVAGFAYVLGRAAHADLDFSPTEVAFIERAVVEVGGLSEAQAVLVVEIARNQAELYGQTEDFLVTREFAAHATREQRERVLRTAFAVAAQESAISAAEVAELNEIGKELGFAVAEVDAIRADHADQLAAIQAMRRQVAGAGGADEGGP